MEDVLSGSLRSQLERFTASPGVYDELRGQGTALRPGWRKFLSLLEGLGTNELQQRWDQSQQLLRENAFASPAHLDGNGQSRPWDLDAIPLLIEPAEWQTVESALQQRGRLLELILADLFGAQRLIAEGVIPAEVLFGNPSAWRPFHGHRPLGGHFIRLYAADMARAPDGSWWILADRCEAPSGLGFALENRVVLSRMFPSEFRECQVRRLAPFFKAYQDALHVLSPRQRDNPRISVLSQGPGGDNYFEDAYLSRYLGYSLVEGDDLTVRERRLYLKTLGGLLPVDVLVRRTDSATCDALELDPRASEGAVGLLQAARQGNVAICNSLGSGLVESPVFMAFLPRLCEYFFGEPLKLPNVATWWCGDRDSLQHVLANLDDLNVKRAFRRRSQERAFTRKLRDMPTGRLRELIKSAPQNFIAQERVERSCVPTWRGEEFASARLALRTYVVAADSGHQVLPGGLARTSKLSDALEISVLDGEGSKDAWVLSERPVDHVTLLPRSGARVTLQRSGNDLPSRVADDVFWLGRYLERSDAAARLLRTVSRRLTSETDYHDLPDLPFLLRALATQGQIEPGFAVEGIRDQLPEVHLMLPSAVMNRDEANSLRSMFDNTVRTAAKVRDRLSTDAWRILVNMESHFQEALRSSNDITLLLNLANALILDLAAFSGTIMESTTRTQAFRFLEIGRRLERAIQLVELFEICFRGEAPIPTELLESVLEIDDSLMTYRARYLANFQLSPALDLLLTDETNPRSLAFQLVELEQNVKQLPRHDVMQNRTRDVRLAMTMLHEIRMIDIEAIGEVRSFGDGKPLERLLLAIAKQLPLLSIAISHRYLVHAGPTRQLSELVPDDMEPL